MSSTTAGGRSDDAGRPSPWADWPVGARVVVRRRLVPADPGTDPGAGSDTDAAHLYTDVIGVVLAATADGVRLRTDAGGSTDPEEVTIPGEEIVAGKTIPPRPPRRNPRYPVR